LEEGKKQKPTSKTPHRQERLRLSGGGGKKKYNWFAVGEFYGLAYGIKLGLRSNNGGSDQSNLPWIICPQHIQKTMSRLPAITSPGLLSVVIALIKVLYFFFESTRGTGGPNTR